MGLGPLVEGYPGPVGGHREADRGLAGELAAEAEDLVLELAPLLNVEEFVAVALLEFKKARRFCSVGGCALAELALDFVVSTAILLW